MSITLKNASIYHFILFFLSVILFDFMITFFIINMFLPVESFLFLKNEKILFLVF